MADTVFLIGIVCVAASIAGGGLEAAGVKVPVISTLRRQILLGIFGVLLMTLSKYEFLLSLLPEYNMDEKNFSTIIAPGTSEGQRIDCGHRGVITVSLNSVDPPRKRNGDWLGLHIRICPPDASSSKPCSEGQPRQDDTFIARCSMNGRYSVTFFNFGDSPTARISYTIRYPR